MTDRPGPVVLTRLWPVGTRTATLSVSRESARAPLHASIEWLPSPPARLSAAEWRQYRAGRNQALAEIAAELGVSAAVLEV